MGGCAGPHQRTGHEQQSVPSCPCDIATSLNPHNTMSECQFLKKPTFSEQAIGRGGGMLKLVDCPPDATTFGTWPQALLVALPQRKEARSQFEVKLDGLATVTSGLGQLCSSIPKNVFGAVLNDPSTITNVGFPPRGGRGESGVGSNTVHTEPRDTTGSVAKPGAGGFTASSERRYCSRG